MTTNPTPFAETAAEQLAAVLRSIHDHYDPQIAPAMSAAVEHGDFVNARRIVADGDHIYSAVNRALATCKEGFVQVDHIEFSDSLGAVISGMMSSELGPMLDDLDPVQLAKQAEMVDRLREAGQWSGADEAENQRAIAATAARYQGASS